MEHSNRLLVKSPSRLLSLEAPSIQRIAVAGNTGAPKLTRSDHVVSEVHIQTPHNAIADPNQKLARLQKDYHSIGTVHQLLCCLFKLQASSDGTFKGQRCLV